MSHSLHRAHVTGDPETCACILRESWPDDAAWPSGQTLSFGSGAFCDFTTLLATRRGHIRCLKYAVENGCALHPNLLREDTGVQMECFKYALELGLEVDYDAVHTACGDISVTRIRLLIEAYQEQTKRRKRKREDDAKNMIVERGSTFIGAVCANAARRQPGEVIQCIDFLRECGCGCGWSETATSDVAREGVVRVLNHLVENGCPWHKETLASAEKSGDAETIAFAKRHDKKVKQRKSLETMFNVIESRKEQMTEQEYIDACRAAKDLHDSL